jgi:hypothetical protein
MGEENKQNFKELSKPKVAIKTWTCHNLSVFGFPSCRNEKIIQNDLEGLIQFYAEAYAPRP